MDLVSLIVVLVVSDSVRPYLPLSCQWTDSIATSIVYEKFLLAATL